MDPSPAGSLAAALSTLGPYTPWIIAAVVAATGLVIGFGLGRRGQGARRVRQLERELREARDEMTRYRSEVSQHFGETSRLLHDLTLQYRNVYEHLAEGASTLCPDGAKLLPRSLAEAALPARAEDDGPDLAGQPRPGEPPRDQADDPPRSWAATERAAFPELDPLLDEEAGRERPAEEPRP